MGPIWKGINHANAWRFLRGLPKKIVHRLGWCHVMTPDKRYTKTRQRSGGN